MKYYMVKQETLDEIVKRLSKFETSAIKTMGELYSFNKLFDLILESKLVEEKKDEKAP